MTKLLKKNTFIIKISILILLLLLSTWNNNSSIFDKSNSIIQNKIGVPFKWLIVYSKESSHNVFLLLFGGNEGIHILIVELLLNLIIIFSILLLVKFIARKVISSKTKIDKIENPSHVSRLP